MKDKVLSPYLISLAIILAATHALALSIGGMIEHSVHQCSQNPEASCEDVFRDIIIWETKACSLCLGTGRIIFVMNFKTYTQTWQEVCAKECPQCEGKKIIKVAK